MVARTKSHIDRGLPEGAGNAALQGDVYNPFIGFSLVHNVAGHPKYPYNLTTVFQSAHRGGLESKL